MNRKISGNIPHTLVGTPPHEHNNPPIIIVPIFSRAMSPQDKTGCVPENAEAFLEDQDNLTWFHTPLNMRQIALYSTFEFI